MMEVLLLPNTGYVYSTVPSSLGLFYQNMLYTYQILGIAMFLKVDIFGYWDYGNKGGWYRYPCQDNNEKNVCALFIHIAHNATYDTFHVEPIVNVPVLRYNGLFSSFIDHVKTFLQIFTLKKNLLVSTVPLMRVK